MAGEDPSPGFDDRAPVDRYCDLILTGGITSAVAYPPVAFVLGGAYRFHAIGGASSGAGIAAAVAAAEYARRRGSPQGYNRMLAHVNAIADEADGRANLSRLFQPATCLRRLFRTLLRFAALPQHSVWHLARDAAGAYWPPLLLGLLFGVFLVHALALCTQQGWIAYVLGALATGLLCVAWIVLKDVKRLSKLDYGLCDGLTRHPDEKHPPLTEWLHQLIQTSACRDADGAPLTFADLHNAPGSPHQTLGHAGTQDRESIRLQMMVANVTLGEPARFPREAADAPLYFRVEEMRRLFPASVVDHMVAHATPYLGTVPPIEREAMACVRSTVEDQRFYQLPRLDLPILVAARMSVSFPLLFRAVPLWREDATLPTPRLRRCLFLDGGLCSNFPIHLFDALVPAWPTFGVHLRDLDPRQAAQARGHRSPRVELPRDCHGQLPHFADFDERAKPGERLFGLAGAMLATIKDWTDCTQARLPGVRDRIVSISLPDGIGGLNLLMRGHEIRILAKSGVEAARLLLTRFSHPDAPTGQARGWDAHRLMRFRLAHQSLLRWISGLTTSTAAPRYATPLRELLRQTLDQPAVARTDPDPNEPFALPLRTDQVAALEGALASLERLEAELHNSELSLPRPPHPGPELRVRPPL